MPFFRRKYGMRRRRRPLFRRSLRRKVRKVAKRLSSLVNSSKQVMTTGNLAVSSSGVITSIHNQLGSSTSNGVVLTTMLAEGSGVGQRTGRTVKLRRLTVKGITMNSAASVQGDFTQSPIGRIMFVLVRDNGGDSLATGNQDITTWISDTAAGYANILNPVRDEMRNKIRIIGDIPINLSTTSFGSVTTYFGKMTRWKRSFNLQKIIKGFTTYSSSTASSAVCQKNHVIAIFLQAPTVTLAGSLTSVWTLRLSFDP